MKYSFLEEKYNNKYNKSKLFEYDQFDDDDEDEDDDELNNIDQEKIDQINYLLKDKKEIFEIISSKKYSDDEVKMYLEYNKIPYNFCVSEDIPPVLLSLAKYERISIIYHILDTQKNISKSLTDDDYNTLLHYAVIINNLSFVKYLINKYHYPVDPTNIINATPFNLACKKENIDIAKFLLSKGADINNTYDRFAMTSLMLSEDEDVIKFLLENNCNVNIEDNFGRTALELAIRNRFVNKAELILEYNPIITESCLYQSISCLYQSIGSASTDCKKLIYKLLDSYCKNTYHNERDYSSTIPNVVDKCLREGEFDVVKYILTNNNIKKYLSKNDLDFLPLLFIKHCEFRSHIFQSDMEVFSLLLENVSDLNNCKYTNDYIRNILFEVEVTNTAEELLSCLFKNGFDINNKLLNDKTPIMLLYYNFDENSNSAKKYAVLIYYFLQKNADLSIKDKKNKSIIYYAAEKNDIKWLEVFLNNLKESKNNYHVNITVDNDNNILLDDVIITTLDLETLQILLENSDLSEEKQESILENYSNSDNIIFNNLHKLAITFKTLYSIFNDEKIYNAICEEEAREAAEFYGDFDSYYERVRDDYAYVDEDDEFNNLTEDEQDDFIIQEAQQEYEKDQDEYSNVISSIDEYRQQFIDLLEQQFDDEEIDRISKNPNNNDLDDLYEFLDEKYKDNKLVEETLKALNYIIGEDTIRDFVSSYYQDSFYSEPDALKYIESELGWF